jgi:hypothetical protein
MKKAVFILLSALVLLVAPFLWGWWHRDDPSPGAAGGLPWQIEATSNGHTRVMHVEPGVSLMSEARALWPDGVEMALLAKGREAGVVQAYAPNVSAGFVTGKAVLTAAIPDPSMLDGYKQRAAHKRPTASGGWRHTLSADDEAAAWSLRVRSLAFHPTARLAEDVLLQRFGEPSERVSAAESVTHWLYPSRGLAITCAPEGRCVFQYGVPGEFEALRKDLESASKSGHAE